MGEVPILCALGTPDDYLTAQHNKDKTSRCSQKQHLLRAYIGNNKVIWKRKNIQTSRGNKLQQTHTLRQRHIPKSYVLSPKSGLNDNGLGNSSQKQYKNSQVKQYEHHRAGPWSIQNLVYVWKKKIEKTNFSCTLSYFSRPLPRMFKQFRYDWSQILTSPYINPSLAPVSWSS